MALRLAMIQFLQHEEHAVDLARIMPVKFGGDVLRRHAVAALQAT